MLLKTSQPSRSAKLKDICVQRELNSVMVFYATVKFFYLYQGGSSSVMEETGVAGGIHLPSVSELTNFLTLGSASGGT